MSYFEIFTTIWGVLMFITISFMAYHFKTAPIMEDDRPDPEPIVIKPAHFKSGCETCRRKQDIAERRKEKP